MVFTKVLENFNFLTCSLCSWYGTWYLGRQKHCLYWGSFNNYVDQNLTNFDPLPPSSEQAWTFTLGLEKWFCFVFKFKMLDTRLSYWHKNKQNWASQQGRKLAKSGSNKKNFQFCQSYSYVNRKVWCQAFWIWKQKKIILPDLNVYVFHQTLNYFNWSPEENRN